MSLEINKRTKIEKMFETRHIKQSQINLCSGIRLPINPKIFTQSLITNSIRLLLLLVSISKLSRIVRIIDDAY